MPHHPGDLLPAELPVDAQDEEHLVVGAKALAQLRHAPPSVGAGRRERRRPDLLRDLGERAGVRKRHVPPTSAAGVLAVAGRRVADQGVGPDARGALPSKPVEPAPEIFGELREDLAGRVAVTQVRQEKAEELGAVTLEQGGRGGLLVAGVATGGDASFERAPVGGVHSERWFLGQPTRGSGRDDVSSARAGAAEARGLDDEETASTLPFEGTAFETPIRGERAASDPSGAGRNDLPRRRSQPAAPRPR